MRSSPPSSGSPPTGVRRSGTLPASTVTGHDCGAADLVARLAFVSTMFTLAGRTAVVLHRGMTFDGTVNWRPAGPFVSATFHRPIAEAQAALGPHRSAGVLISQRVSIDRLVMTFHETAAMNRSFREAEAVVLAAPTTVFSDWHIRLVDVAGR